ncbi:unnamed protein product, partial [Allacma fusca]
MQEYLSLMHRNQSVSEKLESFSKYYPKLKIAQIQWNH